MPPPKKTFSRALLCNKCSAYFTLTLDPFPGWTREQIPDTFPHYAGFLSEIRWCPVCKSPLEGLN